MKKIYLFLFLNFCSISSIFCNNSEKIDQVGPYIGLNFLASFSEINNKVTGIIFPLFSNLETGFAINSGYNFRNGHSAEGRISLGTANELYSAFQFHLGYKYYTGLLYNSNKGLYLGSFIKFVTLNNNETDINYYNVIPYLTTGYQFDFKNMYFDIRLNQTIYAISWSNNKYTSVGHGFKFSLWEDISPIIPYFSTNIGYKF